MNIEINKELEELVEKYFPKGHKDRGSALVLLGVAHVEIDKVKADIEKIRMITYATFGERNQDTKQAVTKEELRIEELETKIEKIDEIIYPKYYNLDNTEDVNEEG